MSTTSAGIDTRIEGRVKALVAVTEYVELDRKKARLPRG
jgi:hypothetical protein